MRCSLVALSSQLWWLAVVSEIFDIRASGLSSEFSGVVSLRGVIAKVVTNLHGLPRIPVPLGKGAAVRPQAGYLKEVGYDFNDLAYFRRR